MEGIMDFTEGFIRTIRPATDIIHDDHDAILDAIERRDPKRASEVASSHAAGQEARVGRPQWTATRTTS
jgi:DNA-binding FadR family transcriptional regulator